MSERRPIGSTLLALLLGLSSVRWLLAQPALVPSGELPTLTPDALRSFLIAAAALAGAIGLWRRAAWSRHAVLVWSLAALSRLLVPAAPVQSVPLAGRAAVVLPAAFLLVSLNPYVRGTVRRAPWRQCARAARSAIPGRSSHLSAV